MSSHEAPLQKRRRVGPPTAPMAPPSTISLPLPLPVAAGATAPAQSPLHSPSPAPLAAENLFFHLTLRLDDIDKPVADDGNHDHLGGSINTNPDTDNLDNPNSLPAVAETPYESAISRVHSLVGPRLTEDMAAALEALLLVINSHLSPGPDPHPLITTLASPQCADSEIQRMANIINTGLIDFAAQGGRAPSFAPSAPRSQSTSRSQKVRNLCGDRDAHTCHLSGRNTAGECSHVLPFSLQNDKAANFWKFVAMFRGEAETVALRAALAMELGSVRGTDVLTNVWWLTKDVHDYFDRSWVCVLPQLTPEQFPYDPKTVTEYSTIIEFPQGSDKANFTFFTYNARGLAISSEIVKPGRRITLRTTDAESMPLPHPLVFQLHTVISRICAAKAAAGYPVLPDDDGDAYSQDGLRAGSDTHVEFGEQPPLALLDEVVEGKAQSQTTAEGEVCAARRTAEYPEEQSRLLGAVSAEYALRMAERYGKMTEQLGRSLEGCKWWIT